MRLGYSIHSMKFLIATDSRGWQLEPYFYESPYASSFTSIVHPGCKLHQIASEVYRICSAELFDLVVIAAGTCDLTHKDHHQGGVEVVYNSEGKVDTLFKILHDIHSQFFTRELWLSGNTLAW